MSNPVPVAGCIWSVCATGLRGNGRVFIGVCVCPLVVSVYCSIRVYTLYKVSTINSNIIESSLNNEISIMGLSLNTEISIMRLFAKMRSQ